MNALRLYGSGGSQGLVLEEASVPALGAGEVLIRVHATAVTPGELEWYPTCHTRSGAPRSQAIPSHEFSGVIEAIGPDVTGWKKGDPVYGLNDWFSDGAAAEYCVAAPVGIAPKPAAIDHLHAAAVPISGLTAWQALFVRGKLEAGQKVLIHGGAGSVGSMAVQLAAWRGAFVATTVSEANAEFVRSLGAHEPIDYRKSKFETAAADADVILDPVGGDTLARSFRAIKPGGRVVTVATNAESSEDPQVKGAFFIVEPNREQLVELARLIDAGTIRPIIGEVFPLQEGTRAYFPTKKLSRGKAVLQVSTP
ncbi:MAG: NADP-dependent oxidoreductase [Verrucomicrobia bacterium]|nr:NADP-dependent oxidoreductase [Verrucomicrobiota bacterium]